MPPEDCRSVLDEPLVSFGREVTGQLDQCLRREWLVTNGLGGYASASVAGVLTRRYHGLLVAALAPPVARTVMVAGLIDTASYDGDEYSLFTHEYLGGTVDGDGYKLLESFELEGAIPVWRYRLADAVLEKRIWMQHGANTSYVSYRLLGKRGGVELQLAPLVTYRDFHSLAHGDGWQMSVAMSGSDLNIEAFPGARPILIKAAKGEWRSGDGWFWHFYHREERARGLDDSSDLFNPGRLSVSLAPGEELTISFSCEPDARPDNQALSRARQRQRDGLASACAIRDERTIQQLVLAADQFLVKRQPDGKSVIAGYPWFNDWGRDTMIAVSGLALGTGRPELAKSILEDFAAFISDGLLPNNFPDQAGDTPGYNTADASLWYFVAVHRLLQKAPDPAFAARMTPVLQGMVEHHIQGTRYGIVMDPADSLLRAGEPGVQLTWMDAKVGDWVITPRIGKPVEINALWYNALSILAELLEGNGSAEAAKYFALADKVKASFQRRFCRSDGLGLIDVLDGPGGDDNAIRPNQVFAVSLPYALLEGDEARAVVEIVGAKLLTSYGLRSLSPDDAAYKPSYGGDQVSRDSAYHEGTVWSWLLPSYAEAHYRVYGDVAAALALLEPIRRHLSDAGLGSISEILDAEAPHTPRGCIAQAWSVGEYLRVGRQLGKQQAPAQS